MDSFKKLHNKIIKVSKKPSIEEPILTFGARPHFRYYSPNIMNWLENFYQQMEEINRDNKRILDFEKEKLFLHQQIQKERLISALKIKFLRDKLNQIKNLLLECK